MNSLQAPAEGDDTVRAESLFFEGSLHQVEGRVFEAEHCFREAISLQPDFSEAHANLALLLDQAGKLAEAESHYRHSIHCNPDVGQTWLNLGVFLAQQKRFDEAESSYRRALELIPNSPAAWSNLGVLQACRKQEAEAELSYRTAIALDANYALAQFNFSYLLLRQGRFEEGWPCLEARNGYAALAKLLTCQRWQGESLHGKSVLIGIEAGQGDMIQFCRYAEVLKAQGATQVAVICHPALKTLFNSLDGIDFVIALDEPLPEVGWDFWTPPLSIPHYCQTRLESIPARLPYLHAERKKVDDWSARIKAINPSSAIRVGLVWKGNPRFENDADRSLPHFDTLNPLGAIAGIQFFGLQKGAGESEADETPISFPVVNLGAQIADFSDTAAIIENLDLVISVDTALAHLTGALGKTCWLLLPDYKTDWCWLTERNDSPWYPGVMRLFRQSRAGEWDAVIAEVREALWHVLCSNQPLR